MNLTDLAKIASNYGAPLLGSVIGGPAGAAIGQVVATAFGGEIKDTNDLIKKITTDAQAYDKMAEIENNHKIELQKLVFQTEIDKIKLSNENTINAREFSSQNHSVYPQILSSIVVLGFFACIYWIAAYKQEKVDHQVLYMLLGILGTSFGAVINFWLGSSANKTFHFTK